MRREQTALHALLLVMNVAVVVAAIGIAYLASWVGWQFCLGALVGFWFVQVYCRLKYKHWVEP